MFAARNLAIAAALAASSVVFPAATGAAAPSLEGTWRVAVIGAAEVPADAGLTITFSGGEISGDTGCNRFSGSYAFTAERLDMGPIRATRKGCKPDRAERESALLRALGTAMRVEPVEGGVVLSGPSGERLTLVRG